MTVNHRKYRSIIIITSFAVLILFPALNDFFHIVNDIKSFENKKLSEKPELDINHLDPFPRAFEKYYDEHFNLRSLLVKNYNILHYKAFGQLPQAPTYVSTSNNDWRFDIGKSTIPSSDQSQNKNEKNVKSDPSDQSQRMINEIPTSTNVLIGKKGWLFMTGNEIDATCGKFHFTQDELEKIKTELLFRVKYLQKSNTQFYFFPVPVKSSVHSNKLPDHIVHYSNQTWGEQLLSYLKNSEIKTINLYGRTLLSPKGETYYSMDNHWNSLGAFMASNKVLNRIHQDFPEVNSHKISEYKITYDFRNFGNVQSMAVGIDPTLDTVYIFTPLQGAKSIEVTPKGYPCTPGFPYCWDFEKRREVQGSNRPKILIISDSFGEYIFPFLAEEFSTSVKIFDSWQYGLNKEIIDAEKPDIVILMALEANLKHMLNTTSDSLYSTIK